MRPAPFRTTISPKATLTHTFDQFKLSQAIYLIPITKELSAPRHSRNLGYVTNFNARMDRLLQRLHEKTPSIVVSNNPGLSRADFDTHVESPASATLRELYGWRNGGIERFFFANFDFLSLRHSQTFRSELSIQARYDEREKTATLIETFIVVFPSWASNDCFLAIGPSGRVDLVALDIEAYRPRYADIATLLRHNEAWLDAASFDQENGFCLFDVEVDETLEERFCLPSQWQQLPDHR